MQGVLEEALAVVCSGPEPRTTVAGRTDAGVHARGQVASADLPAAVAHDRLLLRRLNGLLPPDVRVRAVGPAPEGFDARFSALSRRYSYTVVDDPRAVDPLRRGSVLVRPRPLDDVAMRAACPPLLGEHDFVAFCRRREGATTVRALLELDWTRTGGELVLQVRADAFCHSMVRSLVGAMLVVGERRKPPEWPAQLLQRDRRAEDVPVAPPQGLVLEEVAYPPDDQLAARQAVTRTLRVRQQDSG